MFTTILLYGIGAAVVAFAAAKIFPKSPIGRIGEAGMAQLDKSGMAIWRKDPVAILQRRINQESQKIAANKDAIQRFKGYLNQNKRDFEKRTAELNQGQRPDRLLGPARARTTRPRPPPPRSSGSRRASAPSSSNMIACSSSTRPPSAA